jgi:hypothetical protein
MGCRVVIERKVNGYEVEVTDPEIKAKNKGPISLGDYKSAEKEYVFKTVDEVLTFLTKNLDKALPADEYDSSFDEALAEDEDD